MSAGIAAITLQRFHERKDYDLKYTLIGLSEEELVVIHKTILDYLQSIPAFGGAIGPFRCD